MINCWLFSLRLSVGSTFQRFRLHRLLGIKLLQVAIIQRERYRLPVEESFKVVGKSGASGDVSASLVALQSQQMLVVALRLLQHQVEEVEDGLACAAYKKSETLKFSFSPRS